ncbi:MAG TPA: type I DNA topoisomerase [Candidatus Kapabacteria bacterium]|nr:type I DNA topoisomerase [Candidatus Kapabacteria bacterium]
MGKKLVIVESPTKARTIKAFLPPDYQVEASMGSVRDLPAKAADVPAAVKKEKWGRLGVDVTNGFQPHYVIPAAKAKVVRQLRDAMKDAEEVVIATDEDREGESIGWHLLEILRPKVPVTRMVFHEITKAAILEALRDTRQVDQRLVRAQETRRILDRLYGYTLSPLLWKKVARGLSAGRVQSVAVRLLVIRERERRAFRSGAYWDLQAHLAVTAGNAQFDAVLTGVGGKKIAGGRDFDAATGRLAAGRDVVLLDEAAAVQLRERVLRETWRVAEVDEKEEVRRPSPPFTTSTLQQEANRKLGLSAQQTMRVAQKLYEQGLITYMRTDSVNLSEQAIDAARAAVETKYGSQYLSPAPRRFTTKSKGAQEAHEAIRPAGTLMPTAGDLNLEGADAALYDMIWKRTMATQMAEARLRFVSATIEAGDATFRANGRRVEFPGFFRAYVEGSDDPEAAIEDRDAPLPQLSRGQQLECNGVDTVRHETKPPARYSEAALVQALEKEGIGRPSTYASIINTIQDRGYVRKQGQQLVPTFTAMAVVSLLEMHFPQLVDLKFTASMEQTLDDIAAGEAEWLPYLNKFYLGTAGLEEQVKMQEEKIDPREACTIRFDDLDADVRVGRFGAYLEKEDEGETIKASLPESVAPADLTSDEAEKIIRQKLGGAEALGHHPETEEPIYLRVGPYGPYVQLGDESEDKGVKVTRTSLPKGITPENITLEQAIGLVGLPRTLGLHPETGKEVKAAIGRFGPYVMHDGQFASLKATDDVLTVGLDRALELFELKKLGPGKRGLVRIIGAHPSDGEPVEAYSGRYGPYVKHGEINAPVPKGVSVEEIALEDAVRLIAERAANPPEKKGKPARKAPAKKSAAPSNGAAATTKSSAAKGAGTTKRAATKSAPKKKK